MPTTMHKHAAYLQDLANAFEHEAQGQNIWQLTREAITEGSVLIDPRNLENPNTCRVLSRAGLLARFGSKHQGVQYYNLTDAGFNALFAPHLS